MLGSGEVFLGVTLMFGLLAVVWNMLRGSRIDPKMAFLMGLLKGLPGEEETSSSRKAATIF